MWPQISETRKLCNYLQVGSAAPTLSDVFANHHYVRAMGGEDLLDANRLDVVVWADSTNYQISSIDFRIGCHYTYVNKRIVSIEQFGHED